MQISSKLRLYDFSSEATFNWDRPWAKEIIKLNNNEFSFSIDTDITNGTPKYIANSNGVLTDRFIKSFVDHKIVNSFKGEALADIQLVHETKNKKTYIKLNSDLQGFSFNLISPFKKDIESTKNFELSYQIDWNLFDLNRN